MKIKIIIAMVGVATALLSSSCSSLDLDSQSSLSPDLVGGPEGEKLLTGIYDAFQNGNINSGYFYLSYVTEDLSADNLKYRATFFQHGEINDNAILTNNVLVSRYFNAPYVGIQRANDLIEIVNSSQDIDETIKTKLLGSSYFLRAFGYYKLVTLFGPVPIVNNRDIVNVPRNSVDEVYDKIIEDLLLSIQNPVPFSKSEFVSVEAAKALLARVYLIKKDYPNAKKYAEEVINSGNFLIESNYEAMFTAPFESKEHILKFVNTSTEGDNALDYFLQHPNMPGSGRAELPVDESLVGAYEVGDTRKAASIQEIPAPTTNSGWYCKKYQDAEGNGAHPYYILRLSEMYLIAAEAHFLSNGSNSTDTYVTGKFNDVRTKRGLAGLASVTLQDIIKERRVEFAFENLRWMDMRRTPSSSNPSKSMATVFLEEKGRSVNDELYPIPTSAIDTNPLLTPNNPGYN